MKSCWIHRRAADTLRILALGWGENADRWSGLPWPDGTDLLALSQWNAPDELPELSGYRRYELLAWSFGVWRAATLPWEITFSRAIAINGTLTPVNDRTGIPEAIFHGTLNNWTPRITAAKFRRRMGGGETPPPRRDDESLHDELSYFATEFQKPAPPRIRYDMAVIGVRDRIFPPENQRNAWNMCHVPLWELDLPHDPGARIMEIADDAGESN